MTASLAARLGRAELAARLEGPAALTAVAGLAGTVLTALQSLARGEELNADQDEALARLFAAVEHLPLADQPAALQPAFAGLSTGDLMALAILPHSEGDEA